MTSQALSSGLMTEFGVIDGKPTRYPSGMERVYLEHYWETALYGTPAPLRNRVLDNFTCGHFLFRFIIWHTSEGSGNFHNMKK